MRKLFRTIDWGFKPYLEALELQKSMVEARKTSKLKIP